MEVCEMTYFIVIVVVFLILFLASIGLLRWILRLDEIVAQMRAMVENTATEIAELRAIRSHLSRLDFYATKKYNREH